MNGGTNSMIIGSRGRKLKLFLSNSFSISRMSSRGKVKVAVLIVDGGEIVMVKTIFLNE